MDLSRLGRREATFIIGLPLVWAILLLFHPGGEGDQVYADIRDSETAWMVVHIGMLIFIPLFGAAIYLLLRGVEGTAARVARIALAPFVVFYAAWEGLYGVGSGILTHEVEGQSNAAQVVQDFSENPLITNLGVFAVIGTLGLIVATIAAGIALHRYAGAPRWAAVLIGVSGFPITAHPPPFGPAGLVLFAIGVTLLYRHQAEGRPAPAARPEAGASVRPAA